MNEKINSFQERAKLLRCEVTDAITGILKENNLSELQLSQNPDEVPWVVWFNDEMYGYDSRVKVVSIEGNGIAVEVYDEDCCSSATLTSDNLDLACTNIDWLCIILNSITYTLSLPKSTGITEIAGHIIEWSYDEPGLSEIPEREQEEIEGLIQAGNSNGALFYNDNDMEFEGTWKIKSI